MGQRLGTPISGNLINCFGYVLGNVTGFGSGIVTFLQTPSSANLRAALTDETGTGAAVFGTSPTITTPNIVGTATNDSASAGSVGEFSSSTVTTGTLTTATDTNITSISLTAGDWDLSAGYSAVGSSNPSVTDIWVSINTVTAANVNTAGQSFRIRGITMADPVSSGTLGPLRVSLAGTTTYYLNTAVTYTGGTFAVTGIIRARRVR